MSYDSSPQIRAEMHLDEVTAERDSLRATLAARDAEIERLRAIVEAAIDLRNYVRDNQPGVPQIRQITDLENAISDYEAALASADAGGE